MGRGFVKLATKGGFSTHTTKKITHLQYFIVVTPWGRVCTARAQRAHEESGVLCYNWQYSCLYKQYYTPATLDTLTFAEAEPPVNLKSSCDGSDSVSLRGFRFEV